MGALARARDETVIGGGGYRAPVHFRTFSSLRMMAFLFAVLWLAVVCTRVHGKCINQAAQDGRRTNMECSTMAATIEDPCQNDKEFLKDCRWACAVYSKTRV